MDYKVKNKSRFVPRVNQLDAIQLDKEISKILREGIINPLQSVAPSILVKYQAELDLLLDTSIWYLSIAKHLSTFGQHILLISYNKQNITNKQLILHYTLTVLFKYLKKSIENKLIKYEFIQKLIYICENILILLSIMNFYRFLKTGKYPTLIDFVLRMDYVSCDPIKFRRIGYDYMTRELIWAGFMEFFGTILPLINYYKIRRFLKATIFSKFINAFINETYQKKIYNNEINFDLSTKCGECNDRPTIPHKIDCGHIFCYYCIYKNIKLDSEYRCPLCDEKVNNISRIEFLN